MFLQLPSIMMAEFGQSVVKLPVDYDNTVIEDNPGMACRHIYCPGSYIHMLSCSDQDCNHLLMFTYQSVRNVILLLICKKHLIHFQLLTQKRIVLRTTNTEYKAYKIFHQFK